MPRTFSLSRADFATLRGQKLKRLHGRLFSLEYGPLSLRAFPKIAFVVSKKVAARATKRNSIERSAREAARPIMIRSKQPLGLILYAKREAAEANPREIRQDIETLLSRVL